MKSRLILVTMILLAFAGTVSAHHGNASYDMTKSVTVKGTVTDFQLVNPHVLIYMDVKDESGKVVNWSIEFGSPNALLRRGLRKTDFPAGTEVVIEGFRAKNGTATLNGRSVKLPDGRNLFTGGSAPDEQPQP